MSGGPSVRPSVRPSTIFSLRSGPNLVHVFRTIRRALCQNLSEIRCLVVDLAPLEIRKISEFDDIFKIELVLGIWWQSVNYKTVSTAYRSPIFDFLPHFPENWLRSWGQTRSDMGWCHLQSRTRPSVLMADLNWMLIVILRHGV